MTYYCMIHSFNEKDNIAISVPSFAEVLKISEEHLDRLPRYSIRNITILESSADVNQATEHNGNVLTFPRPIAQMRVIK